eukprot:jgi/Galph1/1111/GphlegSOOS_G5770.1
MYLAFGFCCKGPCVTKQEVFLQAFANPLNRHIRRKNVFRFTSLLNIIAKKSTAKNDWGFRPPDIPTLEERYRAELAYVEEKFGPNRYGKRDPLDSRLLKKQERLREERANGLSHYNKLKFTVLQATLGIGGAVLPMCWWFGSGKIALSYAVGLTGSLLYIWLLSRSVESLSEAANQRRSLLDLLGPARFLIVALLLGVAAKHKQYLELIPVFMGLLTYKIAAFVPLLLEDTDTPKQTTEKQKETLPMKNQATDSSSLLV